MSFILLASALPFFANGGVLSKDELIAAEARLGNLKTFMEQLHEDTYVRSVETCTANFATWDEKCKDVPEDLCRQESCFKTRETEERGDETMGFTAESCSETFNAGFGGTCEKTGLGDWDECWQFAESQQDGHNWQWNRPRHICCMDEEKRCELAFDGSGKEMESTNFGSCCEMCIDDPDSCTMENAEMRGLALLGTTLGECYRCMLTINGEKIHVQGSSEGDCSSRGYCIGAFDRHDEHSCNEAGGTMMYGEWEEQTEESLRSDEDLCRASACTSCSQENHLQTQFECEARGYEWTVIDGPTDWDSCHEAMGNIGKSGNWREIGEYEDGEVLGVDDTSLDYRYTSEHRWTHGPSHTEPEHVIKHCADSTAMLADAASGLTAADAYDQNPEYYHSIHRSILSNAIVGNAEEAVLRASISFVDGFKGNDLCFLGLFEAVNRGAVSFETGPETHIVVLNPVNLAGGDEMRGSGNGRVSVLGARSSGAINIESDGTAEIWGAENSGPISVSGNGEAIITNTVNTAEGHITATGVTASFYNVVNRGVLEATDVRTAAYGVENYGDFTVRGRSEVHIELAVCEGRIEFGPNVTGELIYADTGNCEIVPGGVTVTAAEPDLCAALDNKTDCKKAKCKWSSKKDSCAKKGSGNSNKDKKKMCRKIKTNVADCTSAGCRAKTQKNDKNALKKCTV